MKSSLNDDENENNTINFADDDINIEDYKAEVIIESFLLGKATILSLDEENKKIKVQFHSSKEEKILPINNLIRIAK